MTLGITTHILMNLRMPVHCDLLRVAIRYAECEILNVSMMNVATMSVVILNVIMLSFVVFGISVLC